MNRSETIDLDGTRLLHETIPLASRLDLHVVEARAELVRLRALWNERNCGAGRALHGGFLLALADIAGGSCSFLNLPPEASATVTIESKANFFRPVRDGYIDAVSEPLHVGRSTIVVQTDILGESARRVARAIQTQAVLWR